MAESSSILTILMQVISFLHIAINLAIGIVVFAKLRNGTAGILIGGGFVASAVMSILYHLIRFTITQFDGMSVEMMLAMSTVFNLLHTVAYVAIGCGLLLIPRLLTTPAKQVSDDPFQA